MKLRELLDVQQQNALISDGDRVSTMDEALDMSETKLDQEVRTHSIVNSQGTVIWHFDAPELLGVWFSASKKAEPDYIIQA